MKEYIIVIDEGSSIGLRCVDALAAEGWLIGLAATPEALTQHADRHGPPALIIRADMALTPDETELYAQLRSNGYTRFLAIKHLDGEASRPTDDTGAATGAEPAEDAALLGERNGAHDFWLMADDFITQSANDGEISLRVRRLLRMRVHNAPISPQRNRQSAVSPPGIYVEQRRQPVPPDEWHYRLSNTERSIIRRLKEAQGETVSLEELADCVEAPTPEARIKGLRVHINRLRSKIEPEPNQPQVITTVRGVGYRMDANALHAP